MLASHGIKPVAVDQALVGIEVSEEAIGDRDLPGIVLNRLPAGDEVWFLDERPGRETLFVMGTREPVAPDEYREILASLERETSMLADAILRGIAGTRSLSADRERLEQAVEELISKLVDKPPLALRAMKMLVDRGLGCTLEAGLALERNTVNYLQSTEDFKESMTAFSEKRKPVYKGR